MSKLEMVRARKPSLWDRVRSYTLGPLKTSDPEIRKYFQGGATSSGVAVSEYTAMNYSAVWAAVRLIANDLAGLPLELYRRDGQTTAKYTGHPLYRLLHDSPNPEMSSFTFRQTLQAHVLTWGNGYAEIERDGGGRPKNLWPFTPDRVTPFRDSAGDLRYRVTNESGRDVVIDAYNMVHIRGLGFDGVQGYSPIAKARESIALGMAAEKFGSTFYGNGSTFGGVLTHPTKFATTAARENFENALRNRHHGVEKANGLLLLEEGITYEQIGIPPNEAQFLESRQFQITEIARWYNLPPYKLADMSRLTYNTIESHAIEYYQSLLPWLETWEQELMWKLISPLERNQQFIEHTVEGLLRADSAGRAALEAAEFNIGALAPNEARALSNRNPVSGGDRSFVPLNMIPLDRVDEYVDSIIQKNTTPRATSTPGTGGQRDDELAIEVRTLTESVTEIRGELAEARKANGELVDDLTAAKVGQEALRAEKAAEAGLRQACEERIEALEHELAVKVSLLKDAEERLAIATTTVAERDAQLEGERIASADTRAAFVQEKTAHEDTLQRERDAVGLSMRLQVERDDALAAQAHLAELLDGAQAALAQEQAERAEAAHNAVRMIQHLDAKIAELERENLGQSDLVATLTQARDTALSTVAEREATVGEREKSLADLRAIWEKDREDLNLLTQDCAAQTTHAKAMESERDAAITARQAADEAREHWRQQYADRVAAALTAHRAVVVDAVGRLVRRETEKARRNQATPQKLRAWAEAFYSLHRETCEDALEPVIRVHLALSGSAADPRAVTHAIVSEHIAHSQQQLRAIVDGEPDEMHQTLERVLTKWETERPGALGDRLLREGVAYVRSI